MNGELASHARANRVTDGFHVQINGELHGVMYNPENVNEWIVNELW